MASSTSRIVTGDHYRMGKDAADLLAQAIGETGTYGFLQFDVPFYNSNNREKGFLAEMAQAHPGLKNVAMGRFHSDAPGGASSGRDAAPAPGPRRHLCLVQRRSRHGRARLAGGRRTTRTPRS